MHLINRENTCCFTGHRPNKLPWGSDENDIRCIELKEKIMSIIKMLYNHGIRHYICGMALGCDMYFCEAALEFRQEKDDVSVEAAIPCEEQASRWSEANRNRYYRLVEECDIETMVSTSATKDCYIKRNKYMVNSSSVLIAVFDGTLGGTMQTVNYAKKKGLKIIEIQPC